MAFIRELGFIGAGNMAEGIVRSVLAKRVVGADQIIVSDPEEKRRLLLADQFGVATTQDNRAVVEKAGTIVFAVKPQIFAEVASGVADLIKPNHRIISIMAGISTKRISEQFPGVGAGIVRVMPNLPIRVGAGVAGLCAGPHATEDDLARTRRIFEAGGQCVIIRDEQLMDAVTAVAGSGPAYFYYFVEAIAAGGQAAGLPYADALKLAENACLGAAKMMLETGEPPADLRRKVTSPGGTTQAAIECMDAASVGEHIRQAILAANRRGQELGK